MVVRISATYSRGEVPVSIAPSCSVTMYCMFCTTGTSLPLGQSRAITESVISTSSS